MQRSVILPLSVKTPVWYNVNNANERVLLMAKVRAFLKRKDIEISWKRYGIDALGAMAQGLFASLLVGTILSTLGQQLHIEVLQTIGGFGNSVSGCAMAIAIGYALKCAVFAGCGRIFCKCTGRSRRTVVGAGHCNHRG